MKTNEIIIIDDDDIIVIEDDFDDKMKDKLVLVECFDENNAILYKTISIRSFEKSLNKAGFICEFSYDRKNDISHRFDFDDGETAEIVEFIKDKHSFLIERENSEGIIFNNLFCYYRFRSSLYMHGISIEFIDSDQSDEECIIINDVMDVD